MSEFVTGIDTHRYNGPVNYLTAYDAGARFVLSRSGGGYQDTGLPFADNQWPANVANAPAVIPCFGAWWYLSGIASTIVAQASFCADLLIPHKSVLTLGFWLDCEWWTPGNTAAANRDMVLRFIDTFQTRAQMPVRGIYTRQSIWDAFVTHHARWADFDLWAARFNSTLSGPWGDGRFVFRDWQTWKFWQYSADGNGQAQRYGCLVPPADPDIDLDRWYSTLDDLYVYAGIQEPELTMGEKVEWLWNHHPEHP